MKLLAWNLNHKASERRLKPGIGRVVKALQPDVLVFNEYVHGASREELMIELSDQGFRHIRWSKRLNLNNQILIASRFPIQEGDMVGPSMLDGGGASNFLHVRIPERGLEVVGLRAPAYERTSDRRDYWDRLADIIRNARSRNMLFAGDVNADPWSAKRVGDRHLANLRNEGWQIPYAEGAWSYASGTRVDHVLLAPSLPQAKAQYVSSVAGIVLAERRNALAISDHAALLVNLPV